MDTAVFMNELSHGLYTHSNMQSNLSSRADCKLKQNRRRRMISELPDEVLAQQIFIRFSLEELIQIRQTCKQWNRVVLGHRTLDLPLGTTHLRQCIVQTYTTIQAPPTGTDGGRDATDPAEEKEDVDDEGNVQQQSWREWNKSEHEFQVRCLIAAHRPAPDDLNWYYGMTMWQERPDLQAHGLQFGDDDLELVGADGPFLLHKTKALQRWVVHNPLGLTYHVLPEEPDADRWLCPGPQLHVQRSARLIPGATDDDDAAAAAGASNYRVMVVTVTVGNREAWIYTHLYTRATDSWALLNQAPIGCDVDPELWPGTRDWRFSVHCFFGTLLVCSFCPRQPQEQDTAVERLWAFDTVRCEWTPVCTEDLHQQKPAANIDPGDQNSSSWLVSYKYVVCSGRLMAIARYIEIRPENSTPGDVPQGRICVYEYSPQRDGAVKWRKLSKNVELVPQLDAYGQELETHEYPVTVVSPFIYLGGPLIVSRDDGSSTIKAWVFDVSVQNGVWQRISSQRFPMAPLEEEGSGVVLQPSRRVVSIAPNRDAVP